MRAAVAVFGVALIVVGAALWYLPLTSVSSSIRVPVGDAYVFGTPASFLIGSVPWKASWTSDATANVTIYSCGTSSGCPNQLNGSVISHAMGTSGSMSWTGKAGQYYLLVPSTTSNVTVSYQEPLLGGLAGIGILGVGVLVAVVGVAMPRNPPKATPSPSA
jgi:hypothetical protein